MSLDRIQVVQNFRNAICVSLVLDGTQKTVASAYSAAQAQRAKNARVGRLKVIIPASASFTVTDENGVAITISNIAAAATKTEEIPVINGDTLLTFSGTGTLSIMVLTD